MSDRRQPAAVTVLGLGPMGAALARALLRSGTPTTVWNRTAARTEALVAEGAAVADSPAAAVRAGRLVLICLRDVPATDAVLGAVDNDAFAGRIVVQLSSSTPTAAREVAARAGERGIEWLSAAIMVPTPLIGSPEALILYSGPRSAFDRHQDTLTVLAGRADHLGADHGLAALFDTAMLDIFFATMTAFLHAAAMTTAQGVDAKTLLPYAEQILGILPTSLSGLARDVDAETYPGDEDNIAMELEALNHIVRTSDETGLDGRLPEVIRDLAATAVRGGHGTDGWSRIIQVLRRGS